MNIFDKKRIIGDMATHNINPTPALEYGLTGEMRDFLADSPRLNGVTSKEAMIKSYQGLVSLGQSTLGHSALYEHGIKLRTRGKKAQDQQDQTPPRRTLIVGTDEKAQTLAKELKSQFPANYNVVGFVEDVQTREVDGYGPILGSREQLANLVQNHQIDEVIVGNCLTERTELASLLAPADEDAVIATQLNGASLFNGDLLPMSIPQALPSAFQQGMKRGFDIVMSVIALLILAPIMALICMATKLTSPGPVLYRQQRVGRNGKPFTIYKFRSMHVDAETKTGPILAQRNDDRTTPIGKFLRATHLDEAPQFYNVLIGDMSIVGPRPERPCFVEAYNQHIPAYPERHLVCPGITGLAQVSAGYLSHAYVKLHYDLDYVYSHSVWRDICILAQTPVIIVKTIKSPE